MTEKYRGLLNLKLLGYNSWWQKATEVVRLTLPLGECKSLVVTGIPQQIVTAATHQPRKKNSCVKLYCQTKQNCFCPNTYTVVLICPF